MTENSLGPTARVRPRHPARTGWRLPGSIAAWMVATGLVGLVLGLGSSAALGVTPGPNLTVTGSSPGSISLGWNATSDLLFSDYTVYESSNGSTGPWVSEGTITSQSVTTFYWDHLTAGGTYWWQVTEYDTLGASDPSNVVAVTQPADASLTAVLSGSESANLSWTNLASYSGNVAFESYSVGEAVDNGSYVNLTTITTETAQAYQVHSLVAGSAYRFVVRTADGCSGASNCGAFTSSPSLSVSNGAVVTAPATLTAAIPIAPANATVGASAAFGCSAQGGRAPYSFAWTFGDGGTGSGANVSHVFEQNGTFPVTCRASDSLGTVANASVTVPVTGSGGQGNGSGSGGGNTTGNGTGNSTGNGTGGNGSGSGGGGGGNPPGAPPGGGGGVIGPSASASSPFGPLAAVLLILAFVASIIWLGIVVSRRADRRRADAAPPPPRPRPTGSPRRPMPRAGPPPGATLGTETAPPAVPPPADPPARPRAPRDLDELFDELENAAG